MTPEKKAAAARRELRRYGKRQPAYCGDCAHFEPYVYTASRRGRCRHKLLIMDVHPRDASCAQAEWWGVA